MSTIPERLESLRQKMKTHDIDAFVVYSADPHMSEYLPEEWKERMWLSGFTGSYGYMAVTLKKAALWTDGRYFVQAAVELKGSGITMMRDRVVGQVHYLDWILAETKKGARIAVNAQLTSHANWVEADKKLSVHQRELVNQPLLNEIWTDRERSERNPIFEHPLERAGQSVLEKLMAIRKEMKNQGATAHVISSLDDVAWTLNLRGSDVAYNPVFLGYILMGEEDIALYVNPEQLTDEAQIAMETAEVEIRLYTDFYSDLENLKGQKVLVDPASNQAIFEALGINSTIILGPPPGNLMKAIKNKTELNGFDIVMVRDGVAMVNFLYWLKHKVGKTPLTEYGIGKKLHEFRSQGENFVGESFATIVGYKGNDALPHYSAKKEGSVEIFAEGSVLIDSGGQYLEGTTDLTRTIPLGEMTEEFKHDYTIVMKAYLALERAKFPKGTRGSQLDDLGRLPLWAEGKDFNHGIGHGVGSFLNVHEGPQAIRKEENPTTLEAGMVLSNEPGYYREGHYGIRHENLMKVVLFKTTEWNTFFQFEVITLCPFFKEALILEELTKTEKKRFNTYHKMVKEKLSPHLEGAVKEWFLELVKPI